MIKKIAFAATVAAAALAATPAAAAPLPTANGSATVDIVNPITFSAVDGGAMNFGTLVRDVAGTSHTVSLSTAGTFTCDLGLTCSGTRSAATFDISGEAGKNAVISISGADVDAATETVTLRGSAGNTAVLTLDLTSDMGAYFDPVTLTQIPGSYTKALDGTAQQIKFGGDLNIPALAGNDTYVGNFTLTADYM